MTSVERAQGEKYLNENILLSLQEVNKKLLTTMRTRFDQNPTIKYMMGLILKPRI